MRSIQTCGRHLLTLLVLIAILAGCGGSTAQRDEVALGTPSSGTQQGSGATTSNTIVNVVVSDFAFSLDTAQGRAGKITFVVSNQGQMPHDFAIQHDGLEQKTAMIAPGQSASLTVDLAPGSYSYRCTVAGHTLLGMQGTFTVV